MHNFGISNSQQTFNRQVSSYKRDTEFQFLCYANKARVLFLFACVKYIDKGFVFLKLRSQGHMVMGQNMLQE